MKKKPTLKIVCNNVADHTQRMKVNETIRDEVIKTIEELEDKLCVRLFDIVKDGETVTPGLKVLMNDIDKKVYFNVQQRLGTVTLKNMIKDSADAEAHVVCYPILQTTSKFDFVCDPSKQKNLAIKFIPLTNEELVNKYDSKYKNWKELNVIERTHELLVNNVCPHFQYLYAHSLCGDTQIVDFDNENIKKHYRNQFYLDEIMSNKDKMNDLVDNISEIKIFKNIKMKLLNIFNDLDGKFNEFKSHYIRNKYSNTSLIIYNELANYDLSTWFKKEKFNQDIINSLLFQVYAALTALNTLQIVHMDLHMGNVLVTKLNNDKGYYYYKIHGTKYFVPNYGFQFKLWDYGRCVDLANDSKDTVFVNLMKNIKRFFSSTDYKSKIKYINDNIKFKKFKKILYSFDVYRVTTLIYNKIAHAKGYDDTKIMISEIIDNATDDLINKLGSKSRSVMPITDANPKDIIQEQFKMFTKKPGAGFKQLNKKMFIIK